MQYVSTTTGGTYFFKGRIRHMQYITNIIACGTQGYQGTTNGKLDKFIISLSQQVVHTVISEVQSVNLTNAAI